MRQHDVNGRRIASFLSEHPMVLSVLYPGLASHPQHDLALRQMSGFGGMIAATFIATLFIPLFFKWLERGKREMPDGHEAATQAEEN